MNAYFDTIYIAWRANKCSKRHLVAKIFRNNDRIVFNYLIENLEDANRSGFTYYPISADITSTPKEYSLQLFTNRLIPKKRIECRERWLKFWDIEKDEDDFIILGLTNGILATDNYEFIANIKYHKELSFITDIDCINESGIMPSVGAELNYKIVGNGLVEVWSLLDFIGYIKIVHSWLFYENPGIYFDLKVVNLFNGLHKKVFVRCSISKNVK